MGPIAKQLETRLRARFNPQRLVIIDDSARHEGHSGARPEGETHFSVVIVSDYFSCQGRLARQRMVFDAIDNMLAGRLHALSVKALTPEEDKPQTTTVV